MIEISSIVRKSAVLIKINGKNCSSLNKTCSSLNMVYPYKK